jgi:1-acyl-sn-glycerol-3-phosphate acyltransferase
MSRALSKWILKTLRWKILGAETLLSIPKFIIIAAPHTSNWDFPLGLLVRKASSLDLVKYLGKSSLFKWPFGWIFKSLGGFPVDRSKSTNMVQSYVDVFNRYERFAIVLAPEGTRRKVDHFKTGFYFIAKGAKVPIIPCQFDWEHREVRFLEPFIPTDDAERDLDYLESLFKNVKGANPEYGI